MRISRLRLTEVEHIRKHLTRELLRPCVFYVGDDAERLRYGIFDACNFGLCYTLNDEKGKRDESVANVAGLQHLTLLSQQTEIIASDSNLCDTGTIAHPRFG